MIKALAPIWRLLTPPWADPRYLDRRFEREGPYVRYRQFGRQVTAVHGLARGLDVLRNAGVALQAPELPYSSLVPRGFLRFMAPADRGRYRPLIGSALSPQVVAARSAEVDVLIARALPRLAGEAPRPVLRQLALHVLTRLLVGLADDDPDERAFLSSVDALPLGHARILRRRQAEEQLETAVDVVRRRAEPGIDSLAGVVVARDQNALADETLARNLVYAVRTGGQDLGSFLHWLLWELARSPDWLERGAHERYAGAIVHETLRLHQSEYLYRRAERTLAVDGHRLRRGGLLRLCVAESHRDPQVFPDPERWDPSRFVDARPPREEYMPFGAPGTSCLGAALAVDVARMFVMKLSAYRVGVAVDGPHEHDGWHWRPNARFRVTLEPVD